MSRPGGGCWVPASTGRPKRRRGRRRHRRNRRRRPVGPGTRRHEARTIRREPPHRRQGATPSAGEPAVSRQAVRSGPNPTSTWSSARSSGAGCPWSWPCCPRWRAATTRAPPPPRRPPGCGSSSPTPGARWGCARTTGTTTAATSLASTRAAMDYLQQLHRRLGRRLGTGHGRLQLRPRAGSSRPRQANRARGKPTDFWSLDLPSETENYVPQILAAARLVAEPAKYGLSCRRSPAHPNSNSCAPRARWTWPGWPRRAGSRSLSSKGSTPDSSRARRHPMAPGACWCRPVMENRSPPSWPRPQVLPAVPPAAATAPALEHPVAGGSTPTRPFPVSGEGRVYLVKAGEDLGSIARAQGIEAQTLADFNGLLAREPLLPARPCASPVAPPPARAHPPGTQGRLPGHHRPSLRGHRRRAQALEPTRRQRGQGRARCESRSAGYTSARAAFEV